MVENKLKRIAIHFPEKTQIDFYIKLKEDGFKSQTDFFRHIMYSYINNDPLLLDYLESVKIKHSNRNKKLNKIKRELINEGEELKRDFGLNQEEIQNIFDLIEENNKDL
jgi:hypothetical protein